MDLSTLVARVRSEFLEMPGLRLTTAQAERLWNLDPASCQRVIESLVGDSFLRRTAAGFVVRAEH